jgi:WXG100 family type VII secretion target
MSIKYDFDALGQHLDSVVKAAKQLAEILEKVTDDVNKLADNWHGSGKEAWHAEQTAWTKQAAKETADLQLLIKSAGDSTSSMHQAVKTAVSGFPA